jgi:hypothetical protein
MFTGVVVQNFSYVFQSTGGAKSITRGEMRAFKKVWAEFSDSKTGLLERQSLVPFLAVSLNSPLWIIAHLPCVETQWHF